MSDLPIWIQERNRDKPESTIYKGCEIETYVDSTSANYNVYRYLIFRNGRYVDGGGPFVGKQEKRAEARQVAEKRIDQLAEKGYN